MDIIGPPDPGRKSHANDWAADLSPRDIHRCMFVRYLLLTGRLGESGMPAEAAAEPWSESDRREWAACELRDAVRESGGGW